MVITVNRVQGATLGSVGSHMYCRSSIPMLKMNIYISHSFVGKKKHHSLKCQLLERLSILHYQYILNAYINGYPFASWVEITWEAHNFSECGAEWVGFLCSDLELPNYITAHGALTRKWWMHSFAVIGWFSGRLQTFLKYTSVESTYECADFRFWRLVKLK